MFDDDSSGRGTPPNPTLTALLAALARFVANNRSSEHLKAELIVFEREQSRLLEDATVSSSAKVESITELANTCFGAHAWSKALKEVHGLRRFRKQRKPGDADGRDPTRRSPDASFHVVTRKDSFLQFCPEELLLLIFSHLDANSLGRSTAVCSYWNSVISVFGTQVWSHLAKHSWNLPGPPLREESWKDYFQLHHNVHQARYRLHTLQHHESQPVDDADEDLTQPQPLPRCGSGQLPRVFFTHAAPAEIASPPVRRQYVAAWPTEPENAYTVALDAQTQKIAWIEPDADPLIIRVALLGPEGKPGESQSLRGHSDPVGLLLSNMEGTLVSFDESSKIIVWNLETMEKERTINGRHQLGFIFSVNVHKRRIVTGGLNGAVIVWNADTGDIMWSVQIDEKYVSMLSPQQNLLNVAIWEDLFAYGVGEGGFSVFNMAEKREVAKFDVAHLALLPVQPKTGTICSSNVASSLSAMTNEPESHPSSSSGPALVESEAQSAFDPLAPGNLAPVSPSVEINENGEVLLTPDPHHENPVSQRCLFPMTLSLHANMLLTNGLNPTELAVWSLRDPSSIYTLTSDTTLNEYVQRRPAELRFAEISRDGSMIFASTSFTERVMPVLSESLEVPEATHATELLAWDFRPERTTALQKTQRRFQKIFVGARDEFGWDDSMAVWLCWDEALNV
ncbi:hypothetical protein HKX48_004108 [Thoreauomyces humboldtii]|nr:hypothetical protein HKX48_004108 [Thoreauomyces humboldtii]